MTMRIAALAAFLIGAAPAYAQSVQELDNSTGNSVSEAGGVSQQMSSVQTLETSDNKSFLAVSETPATRNERITNSVTAVFVARRSSDETVASIQRRGAAKTPLVMRGGIAGGAYDVAPVAAPEQSEPEIAANPQQPAAASQGATRGKNNAEEPAPQIAAAPSETYSPPAPVKRVEPKLEPVRTPSPRQMPQ